MNGPEGGGPSPEEMGVDVNSETGDSAPPPPSSGGGGDGGGVSGGIPPRVPPRPQGFWARIFRQRPEPIEGADEDIREVSEEDQQRIANEEGVRRIERMENPREEIRLPNTPEELTELLARLNECQWRERQIEERYGQGFMGRARAFLAGERDFELTQDGDTRGRAWTELARKAAAIGIKIAPGAAAIGVIGIFTGGVGLPAMGALFGSAGGRGFVEAWHSLNGKERGLREHVARLQYHQWFRLREMATSAQEEGISDEERNERLKALIDAYHHTTEKISEKQQELVGMQEVWNRRRKIGQIIGGVAGLGAGIWAGFAGLSRQAMTMDIDGDKISHLVERVNGDWHYVYNTQQEIIDATAQGATLTPDAAGYATHALGESTGTVVLHAAKNLAGHGAQIGGLLAGLWAGGVLERGLGSGNEARFEDERAEKEDMREQERQFLQEQAPPPTGPEPMTQEQHQWQERFAEANKPLPGAEQVWIIDYNRQLGAILINSIDYETGQANITRLDAEQRPMPGEDGSQEEVLSLNELLQYGNLSQDFINHWAEQFEEGDEINLVNYNHEFIDSRGRAISEGRYQINIEAQDSNNPQLPREVTLSRQGYPDVKMPSFALALMGVHRLTPPQEQAEAGEPKVRLPVTGEIWNITKKSYLNKRLKDNLPDVFVIGTIDTENNEINIYNYNNEKQKYTLTFKEWQRFGRAFGRRGTINK